MRTCCLKQAFLVDRWAGGGEEAKREDDNESREEEVKVAKVDNVVRGGRREMERQTFFFAKDDGRENRS